jgi:predicted nuclease with RNAse H fold
VSVLFTEPVYLGINPSSGTKPFHFAALSDKLRIVASYQGDMEGVLAFAAGLQSGVAAVDAPASLSRSSMGRPDLRARFGLPAESRTWARWKLGEYELRRRNIRLYRTPTESRQAPAWMRQGMQLHARLRKIGFEPYDGKGGRADRALLEVNPHACFTALLRRRPFAKQSLEGRMQRQLVLYLEGVDLPNPLEALEEITRHHLLSGQLPLSDLLSHQALDALMAAYTACLAARQPDRTMQLGDPSEGLITLPVPALLDRYP